jgi:tetratricopeptide (TPR) repeat protein
MGMGEAPREHNDNTTPQRPADSWLDVPAVAQRPVSSNEAISPNLAQRIADALELADVQRRYDQALDLMRAAPELATGAEDAGIPMRDRAAALVGEGDILLRMGRYAECLRASACALRLAPDDAHAWYNVVKMFSAVGDDKRALRIAERGLTLATPPQRRGLLVCKGVVLMQLRRYKEALALFIRLQRELPDSPGVWSHTAEVLLKLGRAGEAVAPARQAIAMSAPAALRAWNTYGEALRRTGDLAGARAAYEERLRHWPDDTQARAGLAQLDAGELQRDRGWFRALRANLYVNWLLVFDWLKRNKARADAEPEIADVVKEEHLDELWMER